MADERLKGLKVAIMATDGVEEVELTAPMDALKGAGADVSIVAPAPGSIQAMNKDVEPGRKIPVDAALGGIQPDTFDGLVLPGGTTNPDKLRLLPDAVAFVRHFVEAGKPIAAICHGPWTLIEAGAVKGKRLTSWPSLQTDLRNAGAAAWVDQDVIVDGQLVTSRKPDDLPAFCRELLNLLSHVPR